MKQGKAKRSSSNQSGEPLSVQEAIRLGHVKRKTEMKKVKDGRLGADPLTVAYEQLFAVDWEGVRALVGGNEAEAVRLFNGAYNTKKWTSTRHQSVKQAAKPRRAQNKLAKVLEAAAAELVSSGGAKNLDEARAQLLQSARSAHPAGERQHQ